MIDHLFVHSPGTPECEAGQCSICVVTATPIPRESTVRKTTFKLISDER